MVTNVMRTLRPGILVSLKTQINGGVSYRRIDLDPAHLEDGMQKSRWETTKVVQDPEELERAVKVRGRIRTIIVAVCVESEHGLLCPVNRERELRAALEEARTLADGFNATAKTTR